MTAPDDLYWEFCSHGELRLQRCKTCGHMQFPPAARCSTCLSDDFEWERVTGHASLWSWVRFHKDYFAGRFSLPYVVVIVELEEGVRMISWLDSSPSAGGDLPSCGQALALTFAFPEDDDQQLPVFRVAETPTPRMA